jgi:hypothetical protein
MADIINERRKTHGDFKENAKVSQAIKDAMANSPNWFGLNTTQKEGLEMLASKIARVLCGDPDFEDHWVDIAGYAKIASEK